MGFELPNGKTARNLQEQVKFLSEKLKDLYAAVNEIGIRVLVVDELPAEGASATIYLVPAEEASQENIYNEYMWIEDEWELIGSTAIDLSDYMTLSTNQTVSGEKTFQNILNLKSLNGDYTTSLKADNNGAFYLTHRNNQLLRTDNSNVFSKYLLPWSNNSYDLGNKNFYWRDFYSSGTAYFGTNDSRITNESGILTLYGGNDGVVQIKSVVNTRAIRPETANTYDLGYLTLPWKDLYLSGKATFSSHISIAANSSDGTRLEVSYDNVPYLEFRYDSIRPQSYYSPMDLGSISTKWQNLYLSGNITDGTNSVSVADLAALITYAKGQGWIS